jgi:hypothetical protein
VLELPAGRYDATWVDVLTGNPLARTRVRHPGGRMALTPPEYAQDVALRVVSVTARALDARTP